MTRFFEFFHRYTGYESFMYSLRGQTMLDNAVFFLLVIVFLMIVLFVVAGKKPKSEVQEQTEEVPEKECLTETVVQPVYEVTQEPAKEQETEDIPKPEATVELAPDEWVCPNCGLIASDNFCTECGTRKPE